MGYSNPAIPWSQFERALSDKRSPGTAHDGDGGDSPAWSRKRERYVPTTLDTDDAPVVPYAELHAHSTFSFLDGASQPEHLFEEAARLRLHALALTDHDGFYGAARMAEVAEAYPAVGTVYGTELSLGLTEPQNGVPDPQGSHLLLLADGQDGYHRLAGAVTSAHLAAGSEKGSPRYDLDELAARADGHWRVLTGCRKGTVRQALEQGGESAAETALRVLLDRFGTGNVVVELLDHGDPLDSARNDALATLAERYALPLVATGNVHYATPDRFPVATALAAVRARRSLDEIDGWLPAADTAHLRSGAEMTRRFGRYPGAIENTVTLADELGFRLRTAKPGLPDIDVPDGHTAMSWLRELTWAGARRFYPGSADGVEPHKRERIERELSVIEDKNFPGYFLIVRDMVQYARGRGILCQGRGSAANSAVCYLLEITAVDSIRYGLPFERFLSAMRDEEPDIDVDFDSDRREEVIQYVYDKYGRYNAAQVANVITYRPKGAVRDMAKALGHSPGQQDAWSKQVERWGSVTESQDHDIPPEVVGLASDVLGFPRHLGIHSGGMVLTDRPVGEVVPIEHARMDGRTVLQWDKDDCAYMGLVKFDMLGLGMLAALQYSFDLAAEHCGERWEMHSIPKEEQGVYDQLCRADTVGVFQVESRAQMGTLPRLLPRRFYDLVIEVALVRPGPIQGGAVHPYIRRRTGEEPITYMHPALEPVLERTLGVPLFQEQLMQMAIAVGNCSGDDADLLRRAMGSKRGHEKIDRLRDTLYTGMADNGIHGADADAIYAKIQAFANFGFAESHSISFALIVYASAWIRLHYPGAFLAALLRAQPMGFYSPQTLVADARRHGVQVLRPDILRSGVDATLEPLSDDSAQPTGQDACLATEQPPVLPFDKALPDDTAEHRRDGAFAVRLGLAEVASLSRKTAEKIVAERDAHGPYTDMSDLARRVGLTTAQLEALAAADAFAPFDIDRRGAMWSAAQAAAERPDQLPDTQVVVQPPLFGQMTSGDVLIADMWSTGMTTDDHPVRHVRDRLAARRVLTVQDTATAETGRRVEVGGIVTHRQRPATASGITFLNVEDETGLVNVICSVGVWGRYRRVARESPAVVVRGILERSPDGVVNLVADRIEHLPLAVRTRSRDFQ
ncbi:MULTISPECIES: error-prone DNA polymerase [unclassified Curtobacterium]|uniref:error-prone DNA polymerase n=1 Tax=unclassified Curtobacterium TaxID=257496 RepID=UPI0008DE7327|nr:MULTISPECIES: error-prone DNA polymerase [unclassified Curtobacterium]OIH98942.1 error-prone DNA polymerase [Curtobacterium sp. MCBA15_003]OII09465.1 error-prone DNA polymerase [Curtobacterium sp. MCBA15_009]OII31156.1 error-prone DNA polymerase [Curtobacterium sp. MMLR14_006]